MQNDVGQELLEFTEFAIEHVASLHKQAAALTAERDQLQARIDTMTRQLAQDGEKRANARPALPEERLEQLSDLLVQSGLVKTSSDKLRADLRERPETLLDLFEQFITTDPSDGTLTSIKAASDGSEDRNSLWRQAVR
jgi:chaperonin cofactor prefoldin